MVLISFVSRCGISLKIGLKVQATLGFRRNLPPSYGHSVFLKDSVILLIWGMNTGVIEAIPAVSPFSAQIIPP